MIQYTNRGLGMIKPWVRFNARPEITILILESTA
jgi:predicted MPP superfamily phosphohydrolase